MTHTPLPGPAAATQSLAEPGQIIRNEVEALSRLVEERCRIIADMTLGQAVPEPAPDWERRLVEQGRRHQLEITLLHVLYASWGRGPAPGVPSFADQIGLLDRTVLFDAAWYLATYPDVAASMTPPKEHYVRSGAFEGRNPGPGFDTIAYYLANPDVAQAGWPALVHYVERGHAEGRQTAPHP